ncbi:MAG: plasmid pRiA4b ORF-3 family protein [Verrucomicrobia bacterium]|nr:plasmid pRiA4b ORF-3 family protein [Verrucomicrobiota bacterium]MBV8481880.1 plasmid pRiA4b ORF-3 family protein [Verrucomicrobiota bacterium]
MSDDVAAIVEVALVGARPAVRRTISIPYALPLSRFHSVLQLVMGWGDRELHIFAGEDLIAGDVDEITDPEAEDESRVTIGELLPFIGAEALYLYDFATEWRHRLRLLDLEPATDQIALLNGSGRCPVEGKTAPAMTGKGKKSPATGTNKPRAKASAVDIAGINQELGRLGNGWRRKRRLPSKETGRAAAAKANKELILLDTAKIRAGYLKDLQSVRDRILAIEDELAQHESHDVPEFRRCLNVEFGARFSVMRELQQEIDWLTARLALVQKLMRHGIRPVGRAYLQALRIEAGESPYPDFPPERDEIPPQAAAEPENLFDREAIRNFISEAGDELTEEEMESLTEDVLEAAGKRDLVSECKSLYRKIVSLLHPDRAGEMTAQRKDLWLRAQDAYADGDVLSLRSILDRCGAGTRDQYLTCSEVIEAIAQATIQLQAIEMFRERAANEASWNFHELNDKKRKSRLRRVTKDLDEEENNLQIQLAELQRECQSLEDEAKEWESEQEGGSVQLDLFR